MRTPALLLSPQASSLRPFLAQGVSLENGVTLPTLRSQAPQLSRAPTPRPLSELIQANLAGERTLQVGRTATVRWHKPQGGFAMFELLLVAAGVVVVTGATYAVYARADAAKKIRAETANLEQLTQNLVGSYANAVDFADVSTANAAEQGLIPTHMVNDDGTSARTAWGGSVSINAVDVEGVADQGILIVYDNVPSNACSQMVGRARTGFYDIRINGMSILRQRTSSPSNGGGEEDETGPIITPGPISPPYTPGPGPGPVTPVLMGQYSVAGSPSTSSPSSTGGSDYEYRGFDPARVAEACNQSDLVDIEFLMTKNNSLGVASGALTPCAVPTPSSETRPGVCPPGTLGNVTQTRDASCPSPYGTFTWSPWTDTTVDCAPVCTLPDPHSQSQTLTCPPGQLGGINQTRDASCPAATGPYTWSAWETTSNTCAPECVLPTPNPQTQSVTCPPGQLGSISQERTATCPAPTGPYTWGTWLTTQNTCTPACVAPPAQTQNVACPPGQLGNISQSRTATCPAPTGPYVWGGWTTNSNTCAPACVVPSPETQTLSCPPGQLGSIQQQRTGSCPAPTGPVSWGPWSTTSNSCAPQCVAPAPETRNQPLSVPCPAPQLGMMQQSQPQIRHASCPAPTGAYTWGTWTNNGPVSAVSNTCYTCPAPETQWVATTPGTCPTGQSGTLYREVQQTRTATCPTAGPPVTWSAWTNTPTTRTAVSPASTCAPNCVAPAPSALSNENTSVVCPAGQAGLTYYTRTRTQNYSCPAPTGPWAPSTITYGGWTVTSNTCTTCPAPSSQAQWSALIANCPAGTYGTRQEYQTRSVTYNCPSGTTSMPPATYGSWTTPAPTTYAGTCSPCPATAYNYSYQWVAGTCPAGQSGTIEKQQYRYQPVSYTCPAGSASVPAGNYGAPTPWYDMSPAVTRNSTCAPNCVAPPQAYNGQEYQYLACPPGQSSQYGSGYINYRNSYTNYSCPAPTGPWTSSVVYTPWAFYYTDCAPSCVAPPTAYTSYTESLNCASYSAVYANTGANATRTVYQYQTYSCPAPTGAYTPSAWTPYSYGAWETASCQRAIDLVRVRAKVTHSSVTRAQDVDAYGCAVDFNTVNANSKSWTWTLGDNYNGAAASTWAFNNTSTTYYFNNPNDWSVNWQAYCNSGVGLSTCSPGAYTSNPMYQAVTVTHNPSGYSRQWNLQCQVY